MNGAAPDESPVWGQLCTTGQRIAGGLMLVNAIVLLLEKAMMPDTGAGLPTGLPSTTVVPAIIDLVIGSMLLSNNNKVVGLAIVRVVLGLLLFGGAFAVQADYLMAAFQVVVSTSFLLLLVGQAGRARIVAAIVLFTGYLAMEALGAYVIATGHNPMGTTFAALRGDIDGAPAGEVAGISSAYTIRAPSSEWYLRDRGAAKIDNPLADQWLMRPALDAHVAVIDEHVPGMAAPVDLLANAVLDNMRSAGRGVEDLGREPLAKFPANGRLLHVRGNVGGQDIESLIAVVSIYEHSYQLMALAPRTNFATVEGELRAAIESFTPPAVQVGAPADTEPGPPGRVVGLKASYAITAPSEQWFLRKTEAAQRDNADADRWLVRPDVDAHVYVIAEELGEAVVDADQVAGMVEQSIRGAMTEPSFGAREPLAGDNTRGRTFHVKGKVGDMALEYDYAVVVVGSQAFQIIGFSRAEFYPQVKDDLKRALESFEPPPAK
jgi:hypothetical protein